MKILISITLIVFLMTDCNSSKKSDEIHMLFLHHSTGQSIWNGGKSSIWFRAIGKINSIMGWKRKNRGRLPKLFESYNKQFNTNYLIVENNFPKTLPYGWKNYPFDYYNIWVKHAGQEEFMQERTLEILTREYQVIIFKHCFPVSNIQADLDSADINSEYKSLLNYKLQYNAIRDKLHQFPETKFVVWTGASRTKSNITEQEAIRAQEFFNWVIKEWDIPGDNIFIWDFYQLQTGGGLYFLDKYARSSNDSHPNDVFSKICSELLFNRLIDVIESEGTKTQNTGKFID